MATSIEESISQREKLENQYDKTVREEIETFRIKAISFLAGEITEDDFRPFRLKHGIYGQRQAGVQMVRCKIPGGLLTAPQVGQLARRPSWWKAFRAKNKAWPWPSSAWAWWWPRSSAPPWAAGSPTTIAGAGSSTPISPSASWPWLSLPS